MMKTNARSFQGFDIWYTPEYGYSWQEDGGFLTYEECRKSIEELNDDPSYWQQNN